MSASRAVVDASPIIGTAGVLVAAARAGLLEPSAVISSVERMQGAGIRFGPRVLSWIERALG